MQKPTFDGPKATSFSYAYASSLKNSWVGVPRKRYAGLTRYVVTYCDSGRVPNRVGPYALVVSPDGRHLAFSWGGANDLFEESGCAFPGQQGDVVVFDDVVFLRGAGLGWDKNATGEAIFERTAAARRIESTRYATVAAHDVMPREFGGDATPRLGIQAGRRGSKELDWSYDIEGHIGLAAIGADFSIVVALDNGMLQVMTLAPNEQSSPTLVAERNTGAVARWLSIVGQHIVLVSPLGTGSRVQAFTGDAIPVFTADLPFEVLQPAIAGVGKRMYLTGKGLVALDAGNVTWSHPSPEPIYASAFEDGSLAVATGKRLDFLKPDGTVDQTFNTEEALVAPPAIAGDGSVWAASAEALYVAR